MNYDAAEAWCRDVVKSGHDLFFDPDVFHDELGGAAVRFGMPIESLHSFLRNIHLIHVKKYSHPLRANAKHHLREYVSGRKSILDLAKSINYPPYMVARLIVENVANFEGQNCRKAVTEAMRDPEGRLGDVSVIAAEYRESEMVGAAASTGGGSAASSRLRIDPFSGIPIPLKTPLSRLASEVIEAIDSDPLYGPRQDRERQSVGMEHEVMLEQSLASMKIPFETETDLRIKGTARTPDILLSCPVGVRVRKRASSNHRQHSQQKKHHGTAPSDEEYEWKVVCWIDSKALFGDVQTHNNSVLPQAEAFVHRFGPGLVLYWFGHAPIDRLGDGHGAVAVTQWNLPELLMLPTGALATPGADPCSISSLEYLLPRTNNKNT